MSCRERSVSNNEKAKRWERESAFEKVRVCVIDRMYAKDRLGVDISEVYSIYDIEYYVRMKVNIMYLLWDKVRALKRSYEWERMYSLDRMHERDSMYEIEYWICMRENTKHVLHIVCMHMHAWYRLLRCISDRYGMY